MNLFVKKTWTAFLLLLLCSTCTQKQRTPEREKKAFIPYTLGSITLLIPASWQQRDYKPGSEDEKEPYIFTPTQRQDSLLGEVILVLIRKQKNKPNLKHLQQRFVESMEVAGQFQVKMLSSQDSVFANRELLLIDFDRKTPSQNLNQIGTHACYYKDGALVTIIGLARRESREENLKKRALFREVIYSAKWINDYASYSER